MIVKMVREVGKPCVADVDERQIEEWKSAGWKVLEEPKKQPEKIKVK